jgi:hypothetical protein
MKKIYLKIILVIAALFSGVGIVIASDLPDCPSSGYFHNCFGTYTYEDGSKYVGEWMHDERHGQGTLTYGPNSEWAGDRYVGEHKDGLHGQGTYTFASGDKYVGEYKDGNQHGQGTYTWSNGDKYVGEWKDDNKHGQGTYTDANGNKYVGKYKDDKRYGQGTITWTDGEKYVGMFKDGKRHGQGTYTYADGMVEEGIWKDGEFQYAQKLPENSSSSGNSKLDNHKEFCEEIGFNPGTEKFGDCVMKMMDKD